MLSHCVSHCSGGDVPQVQQGKTAHLLVTTLRQTASHTVSLRQVGKWIAANPASDLHTPFSMQGKKGGCKKCCILQFWEIKVLVFRLLTPVINVFIMCSFFILCRFRYVWIVEPSLSICLFLPEFPPTFFPLVTALRTFYSRLGLSLSFQHFAFSFMSTPSFPLWITLSYDAAFS